MNVTNMKNYVQFQHIPPSNPLTNPAIANKGVKFANDLTPNPSAITATRPHRNQLPASVIGDDDAADIADTKLCSSR